MKNKLIVATACFLSSLLSVGCAQDTNVKNTQFAGTWYPGSRAALDKYLDNVLGKADPAKIDGKIIGIIAPHAGYVYSAEVAAFGYKAASHFAFDTVVLLGPTHRYRFEGAVIYPEGAFATPLGNLEIDSSMAKEFAALPFVAIAPQYFDDEHSLEVQLPFIRKTLGKVKILPVLFGRANYAQIKAVGDKLTELSKKKSILVIASTDLSHFHPYHEAVTIDTKTVDYIAKNNDYGLWLSEELGEERACGIRPVIALLIYTQNRNGEIKILKYANSGDTAGKKDSVVGYLSAVSYIKGEEKMEYTLNEQEKKYLLEVARSTLEEYLKTRRTPKLDPPQSQALKENRGAFVTLKKHGQLRGCIGRITGDTPLYKVVSEFAIHAATRDPRFEPVEHSDLADIEIEISVLTPFEEVKSIDEIEVGKHGLMIRKGFASGLLLPQVPVEWGWDRTTFLQQTCNKAGLPTDAYKDRGATLYKFSAIVFGEGNH